MAGTSRSVGSVLGVALLALAAGCSAAVPGTPVAEPGPPPLPVSDGGAAYVPLALTVDDVPGTSFTEDVVDLADEVGTPPRTTPAACADASPISARTAPNSYFVTFDRGGAVESYAQLLAPAENLRLTELTDLLAECDRYTLEGSTGEVEVEIEVVDVPDVAGVPAVAVRSTSTLGSRSTARYQLAAETRDVLLVVSGIGEDLDEGTADDLFTTAVQRLVDG